MPHDDKKISQPVFDTATYWGSKKFAYDGDGLVIYIGKNKAQNAATSLTDWYIAKFTWSSGSLTDIELLQGSWDGRTTLNWN